LPRRRCRFCQKLFELSKFCPDQDVCADPACRSRRRNEYHRQKIASDPEYAEVVRDSRRKWREAHPDYQKTYRQTHEAAVERNRTLQEAPRLDREFCAGKVASPIDFALLRVILYTLDAKPPLHVFCFDAVLHKPRCGSALRPG
jgi:hypothetical protein